MVFLILTEFETLYIIPLCTVKHKNLTEILNVHGTSDYIYLVATYLNYDFMVGCSLLTCVSKYGLNIYISRLIAIL